MTTLTKFWSAHARHLAAAAAAEVAAAEAAAAAANVTLPGNFHLLSVPLLQERLTEILFVPRGRGLRIRLLQALL
jgi:hypothetical protein